MNALRLVMVTTMLATFALVTPASADWYVVKDSHGQMAVIDQMPGYGWSLLFGPFASRDAAEREMGTGTGRLPDGMAGVPAPAVTKTAVPIVPEFLESEEFLVSEFPEAPAPARRVARASAPAAVSQDFGVPAAAGMEKPAGEMAEFELFELKGESARDSAGKDLGRIDHLMVAKDGRISYVIFSRQGKFVPVPWEAVHFGAPREALIIDVDKDKLASAPAFDRKDFHKDMSKPDFHDKVAGFFQGSAHRAEMPAMEKHSGAASMKMPEKKMQTEVPVEAPHSAPMNK